MTACDNIDMIVRHAGGYGLCIFTCKDAGNYIDSYRSQKLKPMLGNDATVLMEYFAKKALDMGLFYNNLLAVASE